MKYILFIFLFLFSFSNALACSCVLSESPQSSIEKSNYVFLWKVTKIKNIWILEWNFFWIREKEITFEIDNVVKWEYYKEIKIKTAWDWAACWYSFEKDKSYFVYTNWELWKLEISLCSRTSLLENAWEDIEAFRDILQQNSNNHETKINYGDENLEFYVIIFLSVILIFLATTFFITKKR